jgi:hypothetical protein
VISVHCLYIFDSRSIFTRERSVNMHIGLLQLHALPVIVVHSSGKH